MAAHPRLDDPVRPLLPRDGSGRYVVVDGPGPLAAAVAGLLRATGVGPVQAGVWAADAADAELRLTGVGAPDLVVLVADGSVDPRVGRPWRRRAVPHLPVVADGSRVVVGPLVTGDPSGVCLGCLQLARTGGEPDRPVLEGPVLQGPLAASPGGPTLVAMGAGLAAMVALAGLGAGAVPAGVSVEVSSPWPRVDHRRWVRHPDCPHHGGGPAVVPLRPEQRGDSAGAR